MELVCPLNWEVVSQAAFRSLPRTWWLGVAPASRQRSCRVRWCVRCRRIRPGPAWNRVHPDRDRPSAPHHIGPPPVSRPTSPQKQRRPSGDYISTTKRHKNIAKRTSQRHRHRTGTNWLTHCKLGHQWRHLYHTRVHALIDELHGLNVHDCRHERLVRLIN